MTALMSFVAEIPSWLLAHPLAAGACLAVEAVGAWALVRGLRHRGE